MGPLLNVNFSGVSSLLCFRHCLIEISSDFVCSDLASSMYAFCVYYFVYTIRFFMNDLISFNLYFECLAFISYNKYINLLYIHSDHDGKVTPEEAASAALYLKDTLGKQGVQELISNLSKDIGELMNYVCVFDSVTDIDVLYVMLTELSSILVGSLAFSHYLI